MEDVQKSGLVFKKMSRNLDRLKNNTFSKQPLTAQEIICSFNREDILKKYGYNLSGKDRFYINTVDVRDEYSFTVFASIQSIKIIEYAIAPNERHYLLDGTFKIVPRSNFYKLLIIAIEYKNDVCIFYSYFQN